MKKKISLFLGVLFLDLTAFLISSTCVSLSWFNKGFNVNFDSQTGKSLANYFASGDGTKGKPYTITESIHFYNFAWLQYLGEFNKEVTDVKTGKTKIDQKYFKLGGDVDMSGFVVPPVGTSEYAFVGNFDGEEYVVNNLTVSNNFDDFNEKHPSVVTKADFDKKNINILGAFGIVGNDEVNDPNKEAMYNLTADGIKSPINCLKNLYLDNVTIKSTSNQLLIGIIAGYVNGYIENCGVHYSKLEIANGTQYISGNQTINLNSNINSYINDSVSNYTLLGAYNKKDYYWDGEPGSGGSGNDFGGSIDIYNLSKRILKINSRKDTTVKLNVQAIGSYNLYSNKNFNTEIVSNIPSIDTYDKAKSISLNNGTFLPLNVDITKIESYDDTSLTSSENILPNNTGYIVGSGELNTASGGIKIQHIEDTKSSEETILSNFFFDKNATEITSNNFAFSYWHYKAQSTKKIRDDDNKDKFNNDKNYIDYDDESISFSRYKDVKKDIFDLLTKNKTINKRFACPLLLFNNAADFTQNNIATMDKAYICGEIKTNYEVYKGGINFTLTKNGKLTFVMPTLRYTSKKSEVFSLYKVTRNVNNQITGCQNMNDILPSTKEGLESGRIYYCEIPLNEGDYFLGAEKGNVPYFMYLDIGASAEETTNDKKPLKNVDFVDTVGEGENKKLNKVDPNNLSEVTFKISGDLTSSNQENFIFAFRRRANVVIYYPLVSLSFNFIETSNKEKSHNTDKISCES